MQTVPKISRERLAVLQPGTLLKLGAQIVTFNGCKAGSDIYGLPCTLVDVTESSGGRRSYEESMICSTVTENIEATCCDYCGRYRLPADLKRVSIQLYSKSKSQQVCKEGHCAFMMQSNDKPKPKARKVFWRPFETSR